MKLHLAQQAQSGAVSSQWTFPPQSVSGSSKIPGGIIDTMGFREAIATLDWAAVTGAPSAGAWAIIVESGEAANLSDATTAFTLETALDVKTAAGQKDYHMLLQGIGRYVRISVTPTYTGGTSPANLAAINLVLGGAQNEPVPGIGAAAVTVFGT